MEWRELDRVGRREARLRANWRRRERYDQWARILVFGSGVCLGGAVAYWPLLWLAFVLMLAATGVVVAAPGPDDPR